MSDHEELQGLRQRVARLEQELAEQATQAARFEQIADDSPNMILINRGGCVVYANKRCAEVLGYTREELTAPGFDLHMLVAPESREKMETNIARHQRGDEIVPYVYTLITRDGRRLEGLATTRVIEYEGDRALLGIIADITQLSQSERALRESEARYRTLLDTSPDPIVATDMHGVYAMANARAADMLGYESVDAMLDPPINALDTIAPEDRERAIEGMARTLASDEPQRFGYTLVRRDGTTFPGELTASVIQDADGQPTGLVAVVRDLTEALAAAHERRRLEEQFQHAQRLESLGVLAGGIAHDFNNLLVGVLGNASLARLEATRSPRLSHALEQIEIAARRAADLTKQMLAYSGRGSVARQVLNLGDLVREMSGLLKVSLPKRLTIEYAIPPDPVLVEADPGQIQQVIMNLITNAADAMEGADGVIKVALDRVDSEMLDTSSTLIGAPALSGDYVCITVIDTGSGMDEPTRSRIFDPFFTTKFQGRGLGLAAVLGIVRDHDGALAVDSEPGRGTTFRVAFPRAADDTAPRATPRRPDDTPAQPVSGTVLVVDDEDLVRNVAELALVSSGFTVATATDGREAVRAVGEREDLSAVLLDLTMPNMDGLRACDEIRRIRADLPIVLSSGYSEAEIRERFVDAGITRFIQKPYDPQVLVDVMRRVVAETADT